MPDPDPDAVIAQWAALVLAFLCGSIPAAAILFGLLRGQR